MNARATFRTILICILLNGFAARSPIAQITSALTSAVTVNHQAATELIPPKPPELTNVPLARLEFKEPSDLNRGLSSYLLELFKRAERPRLTEGEKHDFTIRTTIVNPPGLFMLNSSSKGFNFSKAAKSVGKFFTGSQMLEQVPENLNIDNTNMTVEARCTVEFVLLNSAGEYLANKATEVVRTNTLRELSMELLGFSSGAAQSAGFVTNLSRAAAQQALVNLTAYHAATNFLTEADRVFLKTPAAAPKIAKSEPAADPAPKDESAGASPWLTPAQAAVILQVNEAAVVEALEKGDLKGRKLGAFWRINRKDLE